jgi:DNA mismatch repair ATPase MutS
MSITELKQNCQSLIEEIEDKEFLEMFFEELKSIKENKNIDFWDELTDEHKKELEESWAESEDEKNLISHEEVMRESKKWLKK